MCCRTSNTLVKALHSPIAIWFCFFWPISPRGGQCHSPWWPKGLKPSKPISGSTAHSLSCIVNRCLSNSSASPHFVFLYLPLTPCFFQAACHCQKVRFLYTGHEWSHFPRRSFPFNSTSLGYKFKFHAPLRLIFCIGLSLVVTAGLVALMAAKAFGADSVAITDIKNDK